MPSTGRYVLKVLGGPVLSPLHEGMYMVNMTIHDGEYEISVGDNMLRHFTQETLPDFIKSKVTMINTMYPIDDSPTWASVYAMPVDQTDVGWRRRIVGADSPLYIIVMTQKELWGLRGEDI
jgi:hypothetical protein